MFGWISRIFGKKAKKQERPCVPSIPRVPPLPPRRRKPFTSGMVAPKHYEHSRDDNFMTGVMVGSLLADDHQDYTSADTVSGHGGEFGGGGASGSWGSSDSSSSSSDSGGDSSSCYSGDSGSCGD